MTDARTWGSIVTPIHGPVPDGKPPWRDNAYVSFWDPDNRVFGAFHVSTSPNSDGRRARFSVSVEDSVFEVIEPLDSGTWTSRSITFDGRSTITVDAPPLKADLELGVLFLEHDYTSGGVIPALGGEEPLHHVEQMVTVAGRIDINRSHTEFSARGFRDRSWGYRDESQSIREYFSVAATFNDFGLTILKFVHLDGTVHTDGHVFGNQGADTQVVAVDLTRDPSGLLASATVQLSDGRTLDLESAKRHTGFWVPMGPARRGPAMSVYDEFLTFRASSAGEGYGIAEHGIVRQLC